MTGPVCHCVECGVELPWQTSSTPGHRPGEASRLTPPKGERCPGSFRKPQEAQGPERRMTAAERKLSREMFG